MMEKYGVARENFPEKEKGKKNGDPLEKKADEKNPAIKVFEELDEISKKEEEK